MVIAQNLPLKFFVVLLGTVFLPFALFAGELVNCSGMLLGISPAADQKVFRDTVHARFSVGLDDEDKTAAYIGVSHDFILQLLEAGRIDSADLGYGLRVYPTKDHPEAKKWIAERFGNLHFAQWERDTALAAAAEQARAISAAEYVESRLRRNHMSISTQGHGHLVKVMKNILALSKAKKGSFSPNFAQIRQAVALTDLKFDKGIFSKVDKPKTDQRLQLFVNELGVEGKAEDLKKASWRTKLEALFGNLPLATGYVLAVAPEAMAAIETGPKLHLGQLRLEDVTGVEPQSDKEFRFLESISDN